MLFRGSWVLGARPSSDSWPLSQGGSSDARHSYGVFLCNGFRWLGKGWGTIADGECNSCISLRVTFCIQQRIRLAGALHESMFMWGLLKAHIQVTAPRAMDPCLL